MLRAFFKPFIIQAKLYNFNLKKLSTELTPLKYLKYIYNNMNSKLLYILKLYKV